MSGKGDKARPMVITKDEFNSNFDAIFRKPQKKDEENDSYYVEAIVVKEGTKAPAAPTPQATFQLQVDNTQ